MWRAPGLVLVLGLSSCSLLQAPPTPTFDVIIHVESDPGSPLPGAVIAKGGKDGPSTGPDGRVLLKLSGQEGQVVDLQVKCPADYVTSAKPLSISLRKGSKPPEYEWSCPPSVRHMVVAVRADNGPNLPVVYLGKILGRTDANGAFTYAFDLKPGDAVTLTLDTDEETNKRISPKNPTGTFIAKPMDEVVTFDKKFTWAPVPVKKVVKPPPPKRLF